MQDLKDSETNCTITRVGDFLKTVCSDVEDKTEYYFNKCVNSDLYFNIYITSEYNVHNICIMPMLLMDLKYVLRTTTHIQYQSCVY